LDSGDLSNYEVRFEKIEKFLTLLHNEDGYMTGESVDFGAGKTLVLPDDFLQEGATLIFKDIASRKVTLAEKGGKVLLDVTFDGFSNLLFWRALNSPYICIEPWSNLPDPADVPDTEFATKEGVFKVEGFAKKHFVRTIMYHA
jgi:galactose mutarotase-like enzyme